MAIEPALFDAQVMHHRLAPKQNSFRYKVRYLALPLDAVDARAIKGLKFNRFGWVSFYHQDHGTRQPNQLLRPWLDQALAKAKTKITVETVRLISMPRVLGMVFNPVSFWMCYNKSQQLVAVVCEVNNTFGETHTYVCTPANGGAITGGEVIKAEKVFHVSPFMQREGQYQFCFDEQGQKLKIQIDYYAPNGQKLLATALAGRLVPLGGQSIGQLFAGNMLLAVKVVGLIHYQALKLFLKGIKYVPKPKQLACKVTTSK